MIKNITVITLQTILYLLNLTHKIHIFTIYANFFPSFWSMCKKASISLRIQLIFSITLWECMHL